MSTETAAHRSNDAPQCRCGFGVEHHFVSPHLKYSTWGWLWMLWGVNSMPREVQFVCRQCGEVVDRTSDPDEMEIHRMGGR